MAVTPTQRYARQQLSNYHTQDTYTLPVLDSVVRVLIHPLHGRSNLANTMPLDFYLDKCTSTTAIRYASRFLL